MAVKTQNYLGINRAVSDYSSSSACEELINLRPTTDGLVPVKPFAAKKTVYFDRIYEHKARGATNYICIAMSGNDASVSFLDYSLQVRLASATLSLVGNINNIHYAAAGNIVLLSVKKETNSKNYAYRWDGSTYLALDGSIPDVHFSRYTKNPYRTQIATSLTKDMEASAAMEIIRSNITAMQEKNPDRSYGPVLVAIAFKTADGDTFWSGNWMICDPGPDFRSATDFPEYYINEGQVPVSMRGITSKFFSVNDYGYLLWGNDVDTIQMVGSILTVYLQVGQQTPSDDFIKSVEVYSTKPALCTGEPVYLSGLTVPATEGDTPEQKAFVLCPQRFQDEMGLEKELMYLQASIPISTLISKNNASVQLRFGGNVQETNRTMDVDAGMKMRFGNVMSYNARFHFFDSTARLMLTMPDVVNDFIDPNPQYQPTLAQHQVVYTIEENGETFWAYLGYTRNNVTVQNFNMTIFAPSINITQVYLCYNGQYKQYSMTASPRYNYSYHYGSADATGSVSQVPNLAGAINAGIKTYIETQETDAINVSEQYNPFLFKVQHSYLAPGDVLEIQPQMAGITDTSFGTAPLNVFTKRGVYALLQGTGTILYSNFRPVSDLVSVSNSVPTEEGNFILAAGGLWLIAGARAILVSDALHEGPHKYIRACSGYRKISGGGGEASPVYDVSSYVSNPTFLEYIRTGARLSYNRYRNEIIVSNASYAYSYVLSLKYRQWFKINKSIYQDSVGGDIMLNPDFSRKIVLDTTAEEANSHILVHLQSRPFSFGFSYNHIHRLVSMVRANLGENNKLAVALYGSENLQDWHLLAYAERDGQPSGRKISQLRTPTAARSWRYYTICIGGDVQHDTDFGPFLLDYKTPVRRIG